MSNNTPDYLIENWKSLSWISDEGTESEKRVPLSSDFDACYGYNHELDAIVFDNGTTLTEARIDCDGYLWTLVHTTSEGNKWHRLGKLVLN